MYSLTLKTKLLIWDIPKKRKIKIKIKATQREDSLFEKTIGE